jgi:hypothetical protein
MLSLADALFTLEVLDVIIDKLFLGNACSTSGHCSGNAYCGLTIWLLNKASIIKHQSAVEHSRAIHD